MEIEIRNLEAYTVVEATNPVKVNIDIFSHNDRNRIMVKGIPSYYYGLQLFWIQKDTSDVEVGSMPKVSIGYGQCEMY